LAAHGSEHSHSELRHNYRTERSPDSVETTKVTVFGFNQYDQYSRIVFYCFCTELDSGTFIDISCPERGPGHVIAKLVTSKDRLTITVPTKEQVANAISDGKLNGNSGAQVRVTSTSDDLCRFLSSDDGKAVFSEGPSLHLHRQSTVEKFYESRYKEVEQRLKASETKANEVSAKTAIRDAPWREWTSADGKTHVIAKLAGFPQNGQLWLTFQNSGSTVGVDMKQLSKPDQEYIRQGKWNVAK